MDHIIIRDAQPEERELAERWARSTPDGDLLDLDVFHHDSTFLLAAVCSGSGPIAFVPVQQPLMMENLIFAPTLKNSDRARAMTRMAEHAVTEAYRRDAGEIYFLCREESTRRFAERHLFRNVRDVVPGIEVYRLNLRETFGA